MNSLCKICGLFVSKENFARHVETHGQNKHRCEICNKTFTTKNYLTEHKRTHREPEEYSCDKCLKVFGMALECERFCKLFPRLFPKRNLTRKMFELSFIMPLFIRRRPGFVNKILRFEQEGEHIHQILNNLEKTLKNIKNKEDRYWVMLKKYENKLYCK